MNHELVIQGKAFLKERFETCCIGIDDGRITSIKKILTGDRIKRFSKQLILPGGIDLHVHFRDPGMLKKETFETGSKAAAFGGVSCVFDMPNTHPPTTTLQNLKDKITHAQKKSFVDFGIYAGITSKNIPDLTSFLPFCSGYKMFLGDSTEAFAVSLDLLPQIFETLKQSTKPILFHAEDNNCLKKHKDKERNLLDHHLCRPPNCEAESIQHILSISKGLSNPIHICHLSTLEGLALLKEKPESVTCGATPHHLLLSLKKVKTPESWYKVNPPIRPIEHSQALFQVLNQGFIDVIESDHAPHTLDEKQQNFDDAPSGIPGVETMIPLFLYLAKKQQISFPTLMNLCSRNPANIIGVPKGSITLDYDADFMVVDLRDEQRISPDLLHSEAAWSPFEDTKAIFPIHVFIRGRQVINDKELSESPGVGSHVLQR
jgi:dihydroorotase